MTHKFFNGSTVYPFGYGLSYTKFNYQITTSQRSLDIKLDKYQHCRDLTFEDGAYRPSCPAVLDDDMSCNDEFEFEVEVQNVGSKDGNEVVMVYSKPPTGIARTHAKQVIGFNRVSVPAGGSKKVKFTFNACKSLSVVENNGYKLLPSGGHTIMVGDGEISFPFQVNFQY